MIFVWKIVFFFQSEAFSSLVDATLNRKYEILNGLKCITHCNVMSKLTPDRTTIGNKQYPRTETTAPAFTDACVAITVNKP